MTPCLPCRSELTAYHLWRAIVQSGYERTDEAVREREEHEFGVRVEIELAHDVSTVRVDGAYRDVQLLAHLLIRVTERKELEDVSLAFR